MCFNCLFSYESSISKWHFVSFEKNSFLRENSYVLDYIATCWINNQSNVISKDHTIVKRHNYQQYLSVNDMHSEYNNSKRVVRCTYILYLNRISNKSNLYRTLYILFSHPDHTVCNQSWQGKHMYNTMLSYIKYNSISFNDIFQIYI